MAANSSHAGWNPNAGRRGPGLVLSGLAVVGLVVLAGVAVLQTPLACRLGLGSSPAPNWLGSDSGRITTFHVDYVSEGFADLRALGAAVSQPLDTAAVDALCQSADTELHGNLDCVVLADRRGTRLVAFRMRGANVLLRIGDRLDEGRALLVRDDLARWWFTTVTRQGRVERLAFPAPTASLSKTFVQTLLAALEFEVPREWTAATGRWETTEEDPNGRWLTRYEKVPTHLRADAAAEPAIAYDKTRVRHLPATRWRRSVMPSQGRSFAPAGGLRLGFDRHGGLLSIDGRQEQTMTLGSMSIGHSGWSVRLRRTAVTPMVSRERGDLRSQGSELIGSIGAVSLATNVVGEDARYARSRQVLGTATADSLLGALESMDELGEAERIRLLTRMEALFRLSPETCDSFAPLLARTDPRSPTSRMVAEALAAAGGDRAQQVLAEALAAHGGSPRELIPLLSALSAVEAPSPVLLDPLERLALAPGTDARVQSAARLVLGVAAGNLQEADPTRAEHIVMGFVRALSNARSEVEAENLLRAIGNTGSRMALPAIVGRTADSAAAVRGAACFALRWVESADAESVVVRVLHADLDENVRVEAALALQYRERTDSWLTAQCSSLERDGSVSVRLAVLRNLAAEASHFPAAAAAIRQAAARDTSSAVRSAAQAAVPPPINTKGDGR